jgi:hypothetical protein
MLEKTIRDVFTFSLIIVRSLLTRKVRGINQVNTPAMIILIVMIPRSFESGNLAFHIRTKLPAIASQPMMVSGFERVMRTPEIKVASPPDWK